MTTHTWLQCLFGVQGRPAGVGSRRRREAVAAQAFTSSRLTSALTCLAEKAGPIRPLSTALCGFIYMFLGYSWLPFPALSPTHSLLLGIRGRFQDLRAGMDFECVDCSRT